MEKEELLPRDAYYVKKKHSCKLFELEFETKFNYLSPLEDCTFDYHKHMCNYLLLLLEGNCTISYRQGNFETIPEKHLILFTNSEEATVKISQNSKVLLLMFNKPLNSCDLHLIQTLPPTKDENSASLSLPIRKPLDLFAELLINALESGINCYHYHQIKHKELFLYLHRLYSTNELTLLFRPLAAKSLNFRYMVMQNYKISDNANQLISLSNMSKSTFYKHFNKEFGMTVHKWMLKQKIRRIHLKSQEPEMTVKTLMDHCGFDTASNFTRFCKQHLGDTPYELIQKKQVNFRKDEKESNFNVRTDKISK